ncbi:hypothetical protein Leryth_006906 [Lithospermum erythrorhizon]|nr:hypothetical protein Leryth_006906 [Lithospermum erythrorhizon]
MKRRQNSGKYDPRWRRKKLFVVILLGFCVGALVFMEMQYSGIRPLSLIAPPIIQKPKIAFLFIARNRLPLEDVWDAFFQVDWGEASMIQAERILIQNALMDPSNERFVFLSDSCIPLYNFSYTYNYIMATSKSFVDSFADTKQGRYNPKMHPLIPVEYWRKGSQWVVLNQKHAEIVMKDDTVFPLFQMHCKVSTILT